MGTRSLSECSENRLKTLLCSPKLKIQTTDLSPLRKSNSKKQSIISNNSDNYFNSVDDLTPSLLHANKVKEIKNKRRKQRPLSVYLPSMPATKNLFLKKNKSTL